MITEFDINKFELQSSIEEILGMDDHLDISLIFEIIMFNIAAESLRFGP